MRRRIGELGAGGGYLAAPTHDIQADTPVENVLAIWDAVRRWGGYPLPSAHGTWPCGPMPPA